MERRAFLGTLAATSALPLAANADRAEEAELDRPKETVKGSMRYRQFGKTGESVSLIGLGGHHIGRQKDEKDSIKLIHAAIDAGITFMDNCWDYHDGASEIRMGKALQGGYRKKVFLMTKIDGQTKKAAADQIDECLKRLKTDVIDLMQYHEMIRLEDPDRVFAKGGAAEAMLAAQKAGKIRYFGFTGHKDPLVHLRMLKMAEKHKFPLHAVQMPLNVMDAHFRSFEKKVVPVLVKKGIAVLGMKCMGGGNILKSKTVTATECLRYAMTLPTATVITGIENMKILKQALDVVKDFKPLTKKEREALLTRTAKAAAEGKFERFKTTNGFDGTARNPKWLGEPDKGEL